MSNVAIDLTKTVKEIITTMKTAIDNLNSDVATNKTAIDNLKTQILEAVYPVGSVYVSITDSRNPADILGFGTWEALPAGYGLVAQGTATAEDGSTLTFTAGEKSGEFKHQLTVGESVRHQHEIIAHTSGGQFTTDHKWTASIANVTDNTVVDISSGCVTAGTSMFGNSEYHNNVSPVMAVYLWKRTA